MTLTRRYVLATACFAVSLVIFRPGIAGGPEFIPEQFAADIGRQGRGPVYSVQLQGTTLQYAKDKTVRKITPTKEQWRAFRRALDEANVWGWRPEYRANVTDGTAWSLRIKYSDHALNVKGHNAYPDHAGNPNEILETRSFTRYLLAVQQLLGNRPFPRRVSPLELFELTELRLVATHPSRNQHAQWADFRDPAGKIHRVRHGAYVGSQSGVLVAVKSASVMLKELYKDAGGDWAEREVVVKKTGNLDTTSR